MNTSQIARTPTDKLVSMIEEAEQTMDDHTIAEIELELERREAEADEMGSHYDSPDIYDTLGERPSYQS